MCCCGSELPDLEATGSAYMGLNTVLDPVLRLVSLCGLLVLAFISGAGLSYFQAFPYSSIHSAAIAAKAWLKLAQGRPATFTRFASQPIGGPTGRGTGNAAPAFSGAEAILIGGGPFENLPACPTYGCLAWIMDRQGNILHKWEIDPQPILDRMAGHVGEVSAARLKPHDWHLQPNGDLVVIFENNGAYPYGGALARFSWDGKLIWAVPNGAHHWMTIDTDGTMYVPINRGFKSPLPFGDGRLEFVCADGGIEVDYIDVVDSTGNSIETIDIMDVLIRSGYEGLLWATTDRCDPLHLNFVQYVDERLARLSGLAPGDLVVSIRNINAVLALSAGDRKVKWLMSGRTLHQHSPRFLPDGSLLIFDNYGGREAKGGSRIVRTKAGTQSVETLFPRGSGAQPAFFTPIGGLIEPHISGERALVTLTKPGRVVELDLVSGEILWDYAKQFRSIAYPGADDDSQRQQFVHVQAYGAYYVAHPFVLQRLNLASTRFPGGDDDDTVGAGERLASQHQHTAR